MRIILSFLGCLLLSLSSPAQTQQFDIYSYTIPKGWTGSTKMETATFAKDGGKKGFCIITLYKSIDASGDSKKNFDASWESLVKSILPVSDAVMQPEANEDGWETQVGSSLFEKAGITGTAILLSSTANSRLSNMLILVNGNDHIKEMQTFLESVKMNKPPDAREINAAPPATAGNSPATKASETKAAGNIPKYEVWMRHSREHIFYKSTATETRFSFFIKYANGDCLDYMPEEGLIDFSKATDKVTDRHWGKVQDKGGARIQAVFPGYTRKLEKKSATEMLYDAGADGKPALSIYPYYKCVSVDGLKLEGEWSSGGLNSHPDWYKRPTFKNGFITEEFNGTVIHKSGTIRFYKDGRFENNMGFTSFKGNGSGRIFRDTGNGTYYFKDFTLVLTYSDGEVFTSAFTGIKRENPQYSSDILMFGQTPFYKNLNRK